MNPRVPEHKWNLLDLAVKLLDQSENMVTGCGGLEQESKEDLAKINRASKEIMDLIKSLSALQAGAGFDVATARHDLRNPLNNILGYTEMLLEDHEENPEVPDFTGQLQEFYVLSRLVLQEVNKLQQLPLTGYRQGVTPGKPAAAPTPKTPPGRTEAKALQAIDDRGEKPLILVVDDITANREVLSRRLRRLGYLVMEAENGRQALAMLETGAFDLVLLDILMPELDGYEVLRRIKANELIRHVPVLMISAVGDINSVVRCLEAGADDYLAKPFNSVLLRARVNASLVKKRLYDQELHYKQEIEQHNQLLEQRVRQQVQEISRAQLAAIFSLSKLAESRDPETGEHLERFREYSRVLARHLQTMPRFCKLIDESFIDNLYAACPLHDIGKVGIPDAILLKPGRLTAEEFAIMQEHATIGAETLLAVDRQYPGSDLIRFGIEIAEGHHERWDGSGYPRGLAGEEIPLVARIVSLADVYDALRSRRVYKEGMDHATARKIIVESAGSHFDPVIVEAFLACEDDFQKIWRRIGE
ncbi:HD domain-containing phosphohydrolase [Desulfurivibrio alkaliphilus]|uniref:histidine kinase n=1 Tax=Desulfurivibrio alkaliphilus (strain DSM 19089 / UNIQEM U267 / AHT2) TaxID=589865 RepID=D6Z1L0_DESAT|nr:HD domain-containing phosphohydrolase [Desulfurivibrio alkaliphilus]ADH85435.1 response regulator receiver modulated metal dependent phosphohydrolase [Desulfurivibrio alkaliphilus AHT 2]